MQSAAQKFPVQQFDTPSPDLALEVKTDERAYVKPPPPPDPPEKEETKEDPAGEIPDTDGENGLLDQEAGLPFGGQPARGEPADPRTPREPQTGWPALADPASSGEQPGRQTVPPASAPAR